MAKNKTVETEKSVIGFLKAIPDETRRKDCLTIVELITKQSKLEPKMWGPSIVGFGSYHYKYDTGREGDMPLAGFSPRKDAIVFYLGSNFPQRKELLEKLGKHKLGGGCLYIKKLEDVDVAVLKKMIELSMKHRKATHA